MSGIVAKAPPDGYTLLVISTGFLVNPSLYAKVPYDAVKDFAPITLVAASPNVISVNPVVPAKTIQELIALIKANPGTYSYASPGAGTPGHLVGEIFRSSLCLDLVHVPFNSAGLAVGSAVGGHTPICFASPSPSFNASVSCRFRTRPKRTSVRYRYM